jgi:hypothetical protein
MSEEHWDHPDNLKAVKAFRSRSAAREYRKFQGWRSNYARIRMFHRPDHPWANKRGNIFALRIGAETPGGWKWLFEHGEITFGCFHGLPKD